MKKILPVLIIGLMFAFNVKAADEVKTTVLYKVGDKTISIKNNQDLQAIGQADGRGCLGFRFYLDGKDILVNENESLGYGNVGGGVCEINDSAIYKTNFKDYFVIKNKNSDAEEIASVYWYFVNSKNLSVLTAFECFGGDCVGFGKSGIQASLNNKNEFVGFKVNDKFIYQPLKPAEVAKLNRCSEANPECGYFPVLVQRVLGLSSDLKNFYFSATGKGWTAYYAYDAKANKITKTTLAKINKDKIKLTLVKKF